MGDQVLKEDMDSKKITPKFDPEVPNKHVGLVWSNKVLLEMILGRAIYDKYAELDRKDLYNLRLLTKLSKVTVCKVLEKAKEPLYTVTMNASNSFTRKRKGRGRVQTSILNKFSNFLDTFPPESYKGFCLKMEDTVFRLEVYRQILNCMAKIGCHLVELELMVPENGGFFPGLQPNSLNFPSLQKLTINFTRDALKGIPASEHLPNPAANTTYLLQSLLMKSEDLKILTIEGEIPLEFQYMHLPESLTEIDFQFQRNLKVLECLVVNHLPNLRRLKLVHCIYDEVPLPKDLLSRILQNCQHLEDLELEEFKYQGPPRTPILHLTFPVMANLQEISLMGVHSQLKHEMTSLSTKFPSLTSLILRRQTVDMFMKWTASAADPSVTRLELELMDDQKPDWQDVNDIRYYNSSPISVEIIQKVKSVFPKLTRLCLYHCGTEFAGLQYVFREMGQLKRLEIIAGATGPDATFSSDHYDSLLIGAPLELVIALGACPNFWKNIKLDNENEPSIKLLKELEYLYFEAPNDGDLGPIITDISFTYALNLMKNLRHVHLNGRFSPSEKLVTKWKDENRTLEFQPDD